MPDVDEGLVVSVLSPTEVVINRGSTHGVREGMEFLVYALGDELKDPATGESLGPVEIVRGRGRVKHVQALMTTLESSKLRTTRNFDRDSFFGGTGLLGGFGERTETTPEPFDQPLVGDRARLR